MPKVMNRRFSHSKEIFGTNFRTSVLIGRLIFSKEIIASTVDSEHISSNRTQLYKGVIVKVSPSQPIREKQNPP